MKQSLLQADALEALLSSKDSNSSEEALANASISCAIALVEHGEFRRALDVVKSLRERTSGASLPILMSLRIGIARVRALVMLWRVAEAAKEIDELESRFGPRIAEYLDEWALIRAYKGSCLWRTNRLAEAIKLLELLRQELAFRPDGPASCVCALELTGAYNYGGDRSSAREAVYEACVSSRRCGSAYWHALSLLNLAGIERQECRWSASTEASDRALTTFRELGADHFIRLCLRSQALVDWKRGATQKALVTAEGLRNDAKLAMSSHDCALASLIHALVLIHLGRFEAASVSLAEAEIADRHAISSRARLLAIEFSGDIQLEQGNATQALLEFERARIHAHASVPEGDVAAEVYRRIGECHLLLREPQKAHRACVEALTRCRAIRERYEEAATLRVLALASGALGRVDECAKEFENAFGMFEDVAAPYEHAKLWMSYGDWLSSEGAAAYRNLSGAQEAYLAAIDHFERIGAEYKLGEARRRLETLDARMKEEGEAYAPTGGKARPARRPRLGAEQRRRSQWAFDSFGLLTRSVPLLTMLEEIASVATSDLPVLVLGESGTGKELVAQGVHALSGRTGEFMAVNCSAVPEAMLEGEFFGYVRGAFTNAIADKPGLFEVAHGGTVFLDEIGEMSPDLQAKLLRFLETGALRRVGATKDQSIDTRIIAATNRERAMLQSGSGFRSDLYYRLAHAVYELPPLRERGDDIELLIDHFFEEFNRSTGKRAALSPAVKSRLLSYAWPGNIRQLASVIQKMVVTAKPGATITPRDLPPLEDADAAANFASETQAGEKRRILRALEQARFVKTEAANILRISRTTLLSKMKRMGIEG